MMRSVLFLIFLASALNVSAKNDLGAIMPYVIVSDSVDSNVSPSLCKVSGTVYFQDSELGGVKIQSSKNLSWHADLNGKFRIIVDSSENMLTFKYVGKEDVVFPYDFKGGHHLKVEIIFQSEVIMVFKPVIYVSSPQEMEVELTLKTPGELTFTYPQLENNTWKVKTHVDGMLSDEHGKEVPYLFWEAELSKGVDFINWYGVYPGAILKTDSAVAFLERTLADLGLNEREATDFITFWGPRIVQQEFTFIQFWLDQEYDQIATLEVSPKPDHQRRIYMLYTNFTAYPEGLQVRPQEFPEFKRDGLTVLEWGGSSIPASLILAD